MRDDRPPPRPAYPPSRREEVRDLLHGVEIRDPYRWLEDASSPEVQEWMRQQDDYARARLAGLPGRGALLERLKELLYVDTVDLPLKRGNRWFYTRRSARQEMAVLCWRDGRDGAERVLLDPNQWSADGSQTLGGFWPSRDGRWLAYTVKPNNADEATLKVLEVASGTELETDTIPGARYASPAWTPAGDGFYYTFLPPDSPVAVADRPGTAEIRFHRLGDPPSADARVRPATGDPRTFQAVDLSADGRWLIHVVFHGWRSNDVSFQDLGRGHQAPWVDLAVGRDAHFELVAWQGVFYLSSDEEAPFGRVFRVDPAHPERAAWREIVPEKPGRRIESIGIRGGRLALACLENVATRLELRQLDGRLLRAIDLPTLGSATPLSGLEDDDLAYYGFTSFTHPGEVWELSIASGESRPWFRPALPFDPGPYLVEQVWYASRDGTRVPMFLVRRRDLAPDGSHRVWLYGYGGFQVSQTPWFFPAVVPWLERGGVYAVANLRGGAEFGEDWHKAGMGRSKQNVFDDFIAAAEALVAGGWTRPGRLALVGESNGGLLVGAVMTQRPDLAAAVVCAVPLLDMLRYHRFGSGETWVGEYGSAEDPGDFAALRAYSPYHHVVPGTRYPATLLPSADSDDRVDPMHARKFTAALQAASTGGPVWLRIEKNSGHGGADLRRAAAELWAEQLAFLLAHLD